MGEASVLADSRAYIICQGWQSPHSKDFHFLTHIEEIGNTSGLPVLTRVGMVWCDGKKQDACVEFLADLIPGQALQPEGTLGIFPDKMEKGSTR